MGDTEAAGGAAAISRALEMLSERQQRKSPSARTSSAPSRCSRTAEAEPTTSRPKPGRTTSRRLGRGGRSGLFEGSLRRLRAKLFGPQPVLAAAVSPLRWPPSFRVDTVRGGVRLPARLADHL